MSQEDLLTDDQKAILLSLGGPGSGNFSHGSYGLKREGKPHDQSKSSAARASAVAHAATLKAERTGNKQDHEDAARLHKAAWEAHSNAYNSTAASSHAWKAVSHSNKAK